MDLLTQPLLPPPASGAGAAAASSRSPPAQPAPVAPEEGGSSIAKHVSTDSQASVESTSTAEHQQQTAEHFAQLRTATAADADTRGLDLEPRIVAPSHANGDWRVYGRVKAQCIFWHEGTLQEKGLGAAWRKSRDKLADVHEWVADGTLWITKTGEIVFVLDPRSAPTLVDRPSPKAVGSGTSDAADSATTSHPRRLSLASLRRSSSRGSASADAHAARSNAHAHEHEHNAPGHAGDASEHQSGIRGFVHKIVSAISPSSHPKDLSAEDTPGDGLRRVSTREAEAAQAARAEAAAGKQPEVAAPVDTTAGGAVQFDEPFAARTEEDPLPAYKGHAITALVIGSAAHIRSIRNYTLSSAETTAPSNLPLSSTGLQDYLSVGGEQINPPVVELDVAAWVAPADDKDTFDEENAMIRKREVTIGFAFRDVLLLHEAEDFHKRIEALVAAAHHADRATTPTQSFGAALMRTLSGRSLGRTVSNEGAAGGDRSILQQQQQQQPPQTQTQTQPQTQTQTQPQTQSQETRPATLVQGRRRSGSWLKAHPQGDIWT